MTKDVKQSADNWWCKDLPIHSLSISFDANELMFEENLER